MSDNPKAYDWSATRGAKWRAQLTGMEAMLKPIDEPLIDALRLDGPHRIADVGCGGGGTTLEVLRRAPAGSVVHGFDISPELIESARARAGSDAQAVAFTVADITTATPDAPYDRMLSRFGVMFFDEPQAAFANLARWLAPGGRLAFAVWGPPADNPWMTSVRDVVAAIVDVPAPEPDAPGPFRYADAGKLGVLLERAGLGEVGVRDWRGSLAIGGGLLPAEAAHFALDAFSSFGDLLAQAGGKALSDARRSLTARFSRSETNGAVRMDACVRIVTGARPR
jgi:SAM-dependent methyltransferase